MQRSGTPSINIHYFTEGHRPSTWLWDQSEGRRRLKAVADWLGANAPHIEFWSGNPEVMKLLDWRVTGESILPRVPFSTTQLQAIFMAPLYTGCRDDGLGYATPGPERPRNARFWIPLLSMFGGLRLNEACQLDVADIRRIDDVDCFVITERSEDDQTDKRLKTSSSERVVPIHAMLIDLSFMEFVRQRKRAGETKLFGEVPMGATGYRSSTFSAWFRRFVAKAGADSPKTCFHSFRHGFRDALREARIDRDIALALGGWTTASGAASVSDAYGSGYRIATLKEAIDRVRYTGLDLSHLYEQ